MIHAAGDVGLGWMLTATLGTDREFLDLTVLRSDSEATDIDLMSEEMTVGTPFRPVSSALARSWLRWFHPDLSPVVLIR